MSRNLNTCGSLGCSDSSASIPWDEQFKVTDQQELCNKGLVILCPSAS